MKIAKNAFPKRTAKKSATNGVKKKVPFGTVSKGKTKGQVATGPVVAKALKKISTPKAIVFMGAPRNATDFDPEVDAQKVGVQIDFEFCFFVLSATDPMEGVDLCSWTNYLYYHGTHGINIRDDDNMFVVPCRRPPLHVES